MYRFLHTADWQIGMRASGLGTAGDKVRAARLIAIGNLLTTAAAHGAQAVLVAGDAFEDNQVTPTTVEQVATLLNDSRVPVYVLPGNHDPLTPGSVWKRSTWQTLRPHVKVLTAATPIDLAPGVTLFPCPLSAKNGTDDPTSVIPPRPPGDNTLRIGLAHGTMRIRPDVGDDDFPIPLDAAERRGLDYLALGHWHSTLSAPTGRAWYSGTHETTKFGERDSGGALLVTLVEAGRPPQVEPMRSGALTWTDEKVDYDATPADENARRFRDWPDSDRHLLRVKITGRLTPATTAAVDDLRAMLATRFLYADIDDSGLRPGDGAAALIDLAGSPFLAAAAEELRLAAESATDESLVAARALELLHQVAWSTRKA